VLHFVLIVLVFRGWRTAEQVHSIDSIRNPIPFVGIGKNPGTAWPFANT
jgi:hypothetical protein